MEEATGAPSSLADWNPKRLRASGRGGETVMTESPSPLTMLFSRHTKRRTFIAGVGSTAAWPVVARAQQPAMPAVGYLATGMRDGDPFLAGIRNGLSDSGFVEGMNLSVEYRWADNDLGRLPEMAADLVRRRVSVIIAEGASAALAAKAATTTIPVVFWTGVDAVDASLVTNLSRPGGNLTGINSMVYQVVAKQIELLHELQPAAKRFGLLINP